MYGKGHGAGLSDGLPWNPPFQRRNWLLVQCRPPNACSRRNSPNINEIQSLRYKLPRCCVWDMGIKSDGSERGGRHPPPGSCDASLAADEARDRWPTLESLATELFGQLIERTLIRGPPPARMPPRASAEHLPAHPEPSARAPEASRSRRLAPGPRPSMRGPRPRA